MSKQWVAHMRVARAMLERDAYVIGQRLPDVLINSCVIVFFFQFIFGYLAPCVGIRAGYAQEVFVGTLISSMCVLTYERTIDDMFARYHTGFFTYRRTLPLPFSWFLGASVASYCMSHIVTFVPLLLLGKILLGSVINLSFTKSVMLCIMTLSSMVTLSCMYQLFVYFISLDYFIIDYWQRLWAPMIYSGGIYFSWHQVAAWSPFFSRLILCNPLIYMTEGLRSVLFGGAQYLSVYKCLPVLWTLTLLFCWYLYRNAGKAVDAV